MTPKYNFLNRKSTGLAVPKRKKSGFKVFLQVLLVLVIVFVVVCIASGVWFWQASRAVDTSNEVGDRTFLVESGDSVRRIGDRLESDGVIRSSLAFLIHSSVITRPRLVIETGRYTLSPGMSMREIINVFKAGGEADQVAMITFLPGGDKFAAFDAMKAVGFDDMQIESLFDDDYLYEIQAKYPRLFDGWNKEYGLEGYFWGDTYEIFLEQGPKGVLNRALARMDEVITDELIDQLAESGRTFYESLILGSIITLEEPGEEYRRIVAQIFLNRLAVDMNLGSDPTYKYGAKLLGVESHHRLESPFNTRIHAGLTPTPIATPSLLALQALADPLPTDALFFLSGDDDRLHTARTEAEHERNIVNYCQVKCFSYR